MKHFLFFFMMLISFMSFASVPTKTVIIRPNPNVPEIPDIHCIHGDPYNHIIDQETLETCCDITCLDNDGHTILQITKCWDFRPLGLVTSTTPIAIDLDVNVGFIFPSDPSQITNEMRSESYTSTIELSEDYSVIQGDIMVTYQKGKYTMLNRKLKLLAYTIKQ